MGHVGLKRRPLPSEEYWVCATKVRRTVRTRRHQRRPIIVWVPVGTNVVLVALAALLGDAVAVALTAVGAVVVACAVAVHLRESDKDKERIAYLSEALPDLTSPADVDAADLASSLTPKPSPVVGEVLRQMRPVVQSDVTPPNQMSAVSPIDRG